MNGKQARKLRKLAHSIAPNIPTTYEQYKRVQYTEVTNPDTGIVTNMRLPGTPCVMVIGCTREVYQTMKQVA